VSTQIDSQHDPLPLADTERLDRICLDFEDAWQAGQTPDLATYLNGVRGAERSFLLRELLLLEVDYLRRRGQQPTAEQYFELFPDDQGIVADVFDVAKHSRESQLAIGHRIGRYVIESTLGSGSFGTVYKAWDNDLERMVALKIPKLDRFVDPGELETFVEEARTTAKLDHPAIVPVLDVVRDVELGPILVMQFIEGCSLRDRILAEPPSMTEAVELLAQVAEAMDYAHRRGFVHRDLEPRNILLGADGRPHITDFGLAIHESTQRAKEGESAGSLAYMSPEQVRGDSHWLDGRADVWALGVIMYELLAGRRPFTGRNFEELASEIFVREPKPLRQINADIPIELEQICLTCLSKNIAGRYATARDLADALRSAIHRSTAHAPIGIAPANIRSTPNSSTVRPTPWICIAVSLFLSVILLAFGIQAGTWLLRKPPLAAVSDIELTVWSEQDEFRGRINRRNHEASPLQTGDKIRLSVALDAPAYLYVLWIGVDGDVTPIYPWTGGKWDRPKNEQPVTSINLPPSANSTWQVRPGPSGTETIMAFLATRPLPSDYSITHISPSIHPQQNNKASEPLWFEDGKIVSLPSPTTRSPGVSAPVSLNDVVISNQLLVIDSFTGHCHICNSLTIDVSAK
jgi:serine/threonine protein kinase